MFVFYPPQVVDPAVASHDVTVLSGYVKVSGAQSVASEGSGRGSTPPAANHKFALVRIRMVSLKTGSLLVLIICFSSYAGERG
jgi:hypothetical protein